MFKAHAVLFWACRLVKQNSDVQTSYFNTVDVFFFRWLKVFRNEMPHTFFCFVSWLPCTCNMIYNISVHVGHAYAKLHIITRLMYLFSFCTCRGRRGRRSRRGRHGRRGRRGAARRGRRGASCAKTHFPKSLSTPDLPEIAKYPRPP